MKNLQPNKKIVTKILELLSHGLTSGLGKQAPGEMCVEAAVCYAYGLPHSDDPPCVAPAVRAFKIALNDANWSSNTARASGLRRLAIAQLGSNIIDENLFTRCIALTTVQKILPIALRAAAKIHPKETHTVALEKAAVICESSAARSAAWSARSAAWSAWSAAESARSAAWSAESAAWSAESAESARSARSAAESAWSAAESTAESTAQAAESTARAASSAAESAASAAAQDRVLSLAAELAVQALIKCKSPGCKYLKLCGPPVVSDNAPTGHEQEGRSG